MIIKSRSKIIYQSDFSVEQTKIFGFNSKLATFERITEGSRKALKITYTKQSNPAVSLRINLSRFSSEPGLRFSVDMKADNVSKASQSWNGIKFMLTYSENGIAFYPQSVVQNSGTFDWGRSSFFVIIKNRNLSETGSLSFGLQGSTGTVYFSNLVIESGDPFPHPDLPPNFKCEYTTQVTTMPQLRGVMSPNQYRQNDLSDLRKWNANLIRWQLTGGDSEEFMSWLDKEIKDLDLALKENQKKNLGINFVIDLHRVPCGRDSHSSPVIFTNETCAQMFFDSWRILATHFKGKKGVWAYDLINEPVQIDFVNKNRDYLSIQYEAAKIIRKIDPKTPIIIESAESDSPNSYSYFSPLPMKDIIYEIHMYQPPAFTHQNVNTKWSDSNLRTYPGTIDKIYYDINTLRKILQPTIDFQKKYNARIYMGEFSAVRWANGAEKYLEDVIKIGEENKWDWSYHAYREWCGWSVECTEDHTSEQKANYTTKRKKVLLKYFKKNSFERIPNSVQNSPSSTTLIKERSNKLSFLSHVRGAIAAFVRTAVLRAL